MSPRHTLTQVFTLAEEVAVGAEGDHGFFFDRLFDCRKFLILVAGEHVDHVGVDLSVEMHGGHLSHAFTERYGEMAIGFVGSRYHVGASEPVPFVPYGQVGFSTGECGSFFAVVGAVPVKVFGADAGSYGVWVARCGARCG